MSGSPLVVYEDERLLAVSKPAGQAVIPGRGLAGEPLNAEAARRAGGRVFVVHRLDREASGLVVFAKDAEAHRLLCAQFEARRTHKTYLAAVEGSVAAGGRVEAALRAFGSGRMGVDPRGKPSLTRYRVLRPLSGATLLELEPVTGRRHQLRVHLFSIGHPILGDALYGRSRPVGGAPRLMLHAYELALAAPFALRLRAEPPADFAALVEALGRSNYL